MIDKSHLLEPRYIEQIRIAENHLKTKSKAKKGTSMQKDRVTYLVEAGAECPICGITLKAGNHNTEHIFPSGLGGANQLHNKTQMCVLYNHARSQILQLMGHPPWHKIYPNQFNLVKQILIWCLITIEDGNDAGKQIPHIHNEFMQIRTGGEDFPNKPTRAFGAALTWSIGDEPNYLHNHSPRNQISGTKAIKSPTLSFFDWIFGYKSSNKTPTPANPGKPPQSEPESVPSPKPESRPDSNPKSVEPKYATFRIAIIDLIAGEQVSIGHLNKRIRKMQEEREWDEVGNRSFLQKHGFDRNYGLLKALRDTFGDMIAISGNHGLQIIHLKAYGERFEKISETLGEETGEFPLISGMNNTASGLKLPRHPNQFVECLTAFHDNQSQFQTNDEIFALFRNILGGTNRSDALLRKFAYLLFPNDTTTFPNKDWTKSESITNFQDFTEKFRENSITILLKNMHKWEHDNPDIIKYTNSYFDCVNTLW